MKIELLKNKFVQSNMLELTSDVECVFRIDSNSGIQGQLLKLSKSNNVNLIESINILLGRLACIGEEWNYKEFKKENWAHIFNPNRTLSQHILKEFEKVKAQIFHDKLIQFREYFSSKKDRKISSIKIKHTYSGIYKFNGANISNYFENMNISNSISELNLNKLDIHEIKSVYVNKDKWNWQLWFLETELNYFLFEEIIIT